MPTATPTSSSSRAAGRASRYIVREAGRSASPRPAAKPPRPRSSTSASSPTSSSPTRSRRRASSSSTTGPSAPRGGRTEAMNPHIGRRDGPPDERVRAGEPAGGGRRLAPADGLRRQHRRHRRQPADQRDGVGRGRIPEGGPLDAGSGVNPATSGDPHLHRPRRRADRGRRRRRGKYTGVQDFDDYFEGAAPQFYDPDSPLGAVRRLARLPGPDGPSPGGVRGGGPRRPSLRRRSATTTRSSRGTPPRTPSTRRWRPAASSRWRRSSADPDTLEEALETSRARPHGDPGDLLTAIRRSSRLVPPDENRQFVSKAAVEADLQGRHPGGRPRVRPTRSGRGGRLRRRRRLLLLEPEARHPLHLARHGLGGRRHRPVGRRQHRRPAVPVAPGRARGGDRGRRARRAVQPPRDPEPDRGRPRRAGAAPCTGRRRPRPRRQPGLRPRSAQLGADPPRRRPHGPAPPDYPNVVAWVAGHSHVNTIEPYPNPSGDGGFWSIRVAAEADWPQQSRLLEIFDNHDGTLSIFGTILDHASPATAPAPGNDSGVHRRRARRPSGGRRPTTTPRTAGAPAAAALRRGRRRRPQRRAAGRRPARGRRARTGPGPKRCSRIEGTDGKDRYRHLRRRSGTSDGRARPVRTRRRDCGQGRQREGRVKGGVDKDRLPAGRGKDRLRGGGGKDRIGGRARPDNLNGGEGKDKLRGGTADDRINAMDGERDRVHCGRGNDFVRVESFDRRRSQLRARVAGGPSALELDLGRLDRARAPRVDDGERDPEVLDRQAGRVEERDLVRVGAAGVRHRQARRRARSPPRGRPRRRRRPRRARRPSTPAPTRRRRAGSAPARRARPRPCRARPRRARRSAGPGAGRPRTPPARPRGDGDDDVLRRRLLARAGAPAQLARRAPRPLAGRGVGAHPSSVARCGQAAGRPGAVHAAADDARRSRRRRGRAPGAETAAAAPVRSEVTLRAVDDRQQLAGLGARDEQRARDHRQAARRVAGERGHPLEDRETVAARGHRAEVAGGRRVDVDLGAA